LPAPVDWRAAAGVTEDRDAVQGRYDNSRSPQEGAGDLLRLQPLRPSTCQFSAAIASSVSSGATAFSVSASAG
jgi:hypothetical protein